MPRTLAPAALTVRNALTRNRLLPAGGDPPSSYLTFTTIVRAACLIRNPKTSLADPAGSDRTADDGLATGYWLRTILPRVSTTRSCSGSVRSGYMGSARCRRKSRSDTGHSRTAGP
jgi:hypothetical protein